MPWCHTCDRFFNPNTLRAGGICPTCGHRVAAEAEADDERDGRAPWHFKALVGVTAVYLGYRAMQGIVWVGQHL